MKEEIFIYDPERRAISLHDGTGEYQIWWACPGSWNYNYDIADETLKKFLEHGIKKIPEPLPLPKELKILLGEKIKKVDYFNKHMFDEDDHSCKEWVHIHFSQIYDNPNYCIFPLSSEKNRSGALYIMPDGQNRILFCGRGCYSCFYYLDLEE